MNLVPGKRPAMDHVILVAKWCKESGVKIDVTLQYLRERVKYYRPYYESGMNAELNHRFDEDEIPNHASLKALRDAKYEIRSIYDVLSTQSIKMHEFTHAIFRIHGYDVEIGEGLELVQNAYLRSALCS